MGDKQEEVKNLILSQLDEKGTLAQIRAQIKASVFAAIDNTETKQNESVFYWENKKIQKLSALSEGQLALDIIKDFLEFFSLDYSNNVFSSEANIPQKIERKDVADKCNILYNSQKPVLLQMVEAFLKQDFSGIDTTGGINYSKNNNNKKDNYSVSTATSSMKQHQKDKSKPVNPVKNSVKSPKNNTKKTSYGNYTGNSNKFSSTSYGGGYNNSNSKQESASEQYGEEQFEEIEEDEEMGQEIELDDDDDYKSNQKAKSGKKFDDIDVSHSKSYGLYTSHEDGALQSQGFDKSVDSLQLEDYDYVEDAVQRY